MEATVVGPVHCFPLLCSWRISELCCITDTHYVLHHDVQSACSALSNTSEYSFLLAVQPVVLKQSDNSTHHNSCTTTVCLSCSYHYRTSIGSVAIQGATSTVFTASCQFTVVVLVPTTVTSFVCKGLQIYQYINQSIYQSIKYSSSIIVKWLRG